MSFKKVMMAAVSMVSVGCSAAAVKNKRAVNTTRPGIYSFESDGNGFNTKNFFYDNGQEVIAFDTQFTPETARKSIEFLRTKTQNPITFVVITHPNPDKFNGMRVFQETGAKVIASKATVASLQGVHDSKKYYFVNIAKMFTAENYPALSSVDFAFEKNHDLRLASGEVIKLSELAHAGVSSNQTVASIPAINALVVGDLVHHKAHAWLEGGIVGGQPRPDLKGWIADLKELQSRFGSAAPVVYGGRGEAAPLAAAVSDQVKYLKMAERVVSHYVAQLGSRKSELGGVDAGKHHAAIQAKMEKAFPDYTLGYMIGYGVYGLANSK